MCGDNVMCGYLNNPAANGESFTPDGWLLTGDLARRDADGYFYVSGRRKELIIKGGENIAPREIDEALLAIGSSSARPLLPDLRANGGSGGGDSKRLPVIGG